MSYPGADTRVVQSPLIDVSPGEVLALWRHDLDALTGWPVDSTPRVAACLEGSEPSAADLGRLYETGVPLLVVPAHYQHLSDTELADAITTLMRELVLPGVEADDTHGTSADEDGANVYAQPRREPSAAQRDAVLSAINDRTADDDGLR